MNKKIFEKIQFSEPNAHPWAVVIEGRLTVNAMATMAHLGGNIDLLAMAKTRVCDYIEEGLQQLVDRKWLCERARALVDEYVKSIIIDGPFSLDDERIIYGMQKFSTWLERKRGSYE